VGTFDILNSIFNAVEGLEVHVSPSQMGYCFTDGSLFFQRWESRSILYVGKRLSHLKRKNIQNIVKLFKDIYEDATTPFCAKMPYGYLVIISLKFSTTAKK